MIAKFLTTVLILNALGAISARAEYPSDWRWRRLRTENFEIIFEASNRPAAEVFAAAAERAYRQLLPIFGEAPPRPIPILVPDSTDLANGMATFLPYEHIIAYPALPSSTDSIDHYENWAFELLLHELAHLFSFAPAHGLYTPLKYVFGSVIRPAGILPRWYLEGLAVAVESRQTTHGRLRSPSTAASLRALTRDQAWQREDFADINETSIPVWPYGQRPYLFGSLIWKKLSDDHGLNLLGDFSQRFGRRLPFLLNAPLKEKTDRSWPELWTDLARTLATESGVQLEKIRNAGEMKLTPLTAAPGRHFGPSISRDGRSLAFVNSPDFRSSSLMLMSRQDPKQSFAGGTARSLINGSGITRISWLPDNRRLVFDQLGVVDRRLLYRDLYLLDTAGDGEAVALTKGARASQPAVSPSGGKVAMVRQAGGATALATLDLASRKIRNLVTAPVGVRISNPEWISDNEIAFIGRGKSGQDLLYYVDTRTLKRTEGRHLGGAIASLRKTPEGLVYAANHSGTFNLYLLKTPSSPPEPLTNSATEVLQGDLDLWSRELILAELTSSGWRLFTTPRRTHAPPQLETPPTLKFNATPPPIQLTRVPAKESDYQPWRYLIPRYWIPFIYPVEGGILFQGSTTVRDPTGRHAYGLDASYDSFTKQGSYGASYLNRTTPIDLTLAATQTNEILAAGGDRLTNQYLAIGANSPIAGMSNAWNMGVRLSSVNTEVPTSSGSRQIDRLGASAELHYRSAGERLPAANWGELQASVIHTHYTPQGNRLDYDRTLGVFGLRLRDPLPTRHLLLVQIKGAMSPRMGLGNVVVLGDRTIGGNYLVSLINSNFLLRGYPSGALVGRTMVNGNLEYRLPLVDLWRGWGTFPLYLRGLEGAIFVDAALVDGAYYNPDARGFFRSRSDTVFAGSGVEFTLNGTGAYHLPLSLTLGLYYGFDERPGGGFLPFLSLGYVGHGGLDHSQTSTRFRPSSLAR